MSKKLFSFLLLVCILLTNVNVYASEVTNQEEDPNKTASFAFNYDLAIKNVNIVNPARNEILYKYNIAISGGKIKQITKGDVKANRVIDGEGAMLLREFIDMDSTNVSREIDLLKTADGIGKSVRTTTADIDAWSKSVESSLSTIDYLSITDSESIKNAVIKENEMKYDDAAIKQIVEAILKEKEAKSAGVKISIEEANDLNLLINTIKAIDDDNFVYYIKLSKLKHENIIQTINQISDIIKDSKNNFVLCDMNDFGGPDKINAINSLIDKHNEENENLYYTFNPFKYIVLTNFKDNIDIVKKYNNNTSKLQLASSNNFYQIHQYKDIINTKEDVIIHDALNDSDISIMIRSKYSLIASNPNLANTSTKLYPVNVNSFLEYIRLANGLGIDSIEIARKLTYLTYKVLNLDRYMNASTIEVGQNASFLTINSKNIGINSNIQNVKPSLGVKYLIHNGIVTFNHNQYNQNGARSFIINNLERKDDVKKFDITYETEVSKSTALEHAYIIDGIKYISLEELIEPLNLVYNNEANGKYTIGNLINVELGTSDASLGAEKVHLTKEVITYNDSLMIPLEDLSKLFQNYFKCEVSEDHISIKSSNNSKMLDTNDSVEKKESTPLIIKSSYIIMSYIFSALVVAFLLNTLKKKKRRKNGKL